MKNKITYLLGLLTLILLFGCNRSENTTDGKIRVVATTTMLSDLVREVGGEYIVLESLMGPGVDPHLYKASQGDVEKLHTADLIVYNGLHLEGKLTQVLAQMNERGKTTLAVGETLSPLNLIRSEDFAGSFDPHIWFDTDFWKQITLSVQNALAQKDPAHASHYEERANAYLAKIDALKEALQVRIAALPKEKRVLVTAHDAFHYFGQEFDFEVIGLQGLSTATEAGVKDVQNLSQLIIDKNVKAIFIESSVPKQTVEALQAAVQAKGHSVAIGGELYSDALGSTGTPEATYIGMYTHNVNTIVNALQP